MTRVFVLSGGGNMGPTQVGALRALLERNIFPDIIIGCSAGSLNAGYLARKLALDQIDQLEQVWLSVSTQDIYPGPRLRAMWRLLAGKDSLYDNHNFYAFLQHHGVTPLHTFANSSTVPLYITATHLASGKLHVFGENPNDRLLDAMMASTALTPLHPPYAVNGQQYVDGGTVTPLPLRVAMEKGATEIYALHIVDSQAEAGEQPLITGVASVLNHSVGTMLRLQAQHDLLLAEVKSRAKLHYIPLSVTDRPPSLDFSQARRLIDSGYVAATHYLGQMERGQQSRSPVAPGVRHKLQTLVTRVWAQKLALKEAPVLARNRQCSRRALPH